MSKASAEFVPSKQPLDIGADTLALLTKLCMALNLSHTCALDVVVGRVGIAVVVGGKAVVGIVGRAVVGGVKVVVKTDGLVAVLL